MKWKEQRERLWNYFNDFSSSFVCYFNQ